jgi:hypothetical protein
MRVELNQQKNGLLAGHLMRSMALGAEQHAGRNDEHVDDRVVEVSIVSIVSS